MRGNLNTRLRKLDNGEGEDYAALVLAVAGVSRYNDSQVNTSSSQVWEIVGYIEKLDEEDFTDLILAVAGVSWYNYSLMPYWQKDKDRIKPYR